MFARSPGGIAGLNRLISTTRPGGNRSVRNFSAITGVIRTWAMPSDMERHSIPFPAHERRSITQARMGSIRRSASLPGVREWAAALIRVSVSIHHRLAQSMPPSRQGWECLNRSGLAFLRWGLRPPHAPKALPTLKMIPDGLSLRHRSARPRPQSPPRTAGARPCVPTPAAPHRSRAAPALKPS